MERKVYCLKKVFDFLSIYDSLELVLVSKKHNTELTEVLIKYLLRNFEVSEEDRRKLWVKWAEKVTYRISFLGSSEETGPVYRRKKSLPHHPQGPTAIRHLHAQRGIRCKSPKKII